MIKQLEEELQIPPARSMIQEVGFPAASKLYASAGPTLRNTITFLVFRIRETYQEII